MKTSAEKDVAVLMLGSGMIDWKALMRSVCNWNNPCWAQHTAQRASLFTIALSLKICLLALVTRYG